MSEAQLLHARDRGGVPAHRSGDARSALAHPARSLPEGKEQLKDEQIKPELHQSVVEVGTRICRGHQGGAARGRRACAGQLAGLARAQRADDRRRRHAPLRALAGPAHHRRIRATREIVEDLQHVARANLIFGLHVHVGDRRTAKIAIHIMNAARYFLPHIFALSTNSPFWQGRNTGLEVATAARSSTGSRAPASRTTSPSVSEYENYVKLLVQTRCIDNAKKIWWDVRHAPVLRHARVPHLRRADARRRDDRDRRADARRSTAKLYKLIKANLGFRLYRRLLISENKWRAARYGIAGKLIDFGKQEEVACDDADRRAAGVRRRRGRRAGLPRGDRPTSSASSSMGTGADRQLRCVGSAPRT